MSQDKSNVSQTALVNIICSAFYVAFIAATWYTDMTSFSCFPFFWPTTISINEDVQNDEVNSYLFRPHEKT